MKNLILMAAMAACLAGCGIKPGSVQPPEGHEGVKFPRTYPDVRVDPVPAGAIP